MRPTMRRYWRNQHGYSLMEIMLVLVLLSMFIFSGMYYSQEQSRANNIDITVAQVQQILTAGLAYYVLWGKWPDSGSIAGGSLYSGGAIYLPSSLQSPYGPQVQYTAVQTADVFYVWIKLSKDQYQQAVIISNRLPLSYSTKTYSGTGLPTYSSVADACDNTASCYVVAGVNVPGQDLNNATGLHFAGLFHHGACVPVPSCPTDNSGNKLIPQVILVPVSYGGYNASVSYNITEVYPMSSFRAFAQPAVQSPQSPLACETGATALDCPLTNFGGSVAQSNWRACMAVTTDRGSVASTRSDDWGRDFVMAAFTRCAISPVTNAEPQGSDFTIYSN